MTSPNIKNESDAEQKRIFGLLSDKNTLSLGYSDNEIWTKPNVREFYHDKRAQTKRIIPDYVIVVHSIPVLVVEAKRPDDDLNEALREARQYANELNGTYPSGINPCKRVIVSDGTRILSSPYDSTQVDHELLFSEITQVSSKFIRFQNDAGIVEAQRNAAAILKQFRKTHFNRAVDRVGGINTRSIEIPQNETGWHLLESFGHILIPESSVDRVTVASRAYVTNSQIDKYSSEVNKLIENTIIGADAHDDRSTHDTSTRLYEVISRSRKASSELILILGERGAGKSTFMDYCRTRQHAESYLKKTVWLHIDMIRDSGDSDIDLFDVVNRLTSELQRAIPNKDFDEDWRKIFSVEINQLNKGILSILKDTPEYAKELYREVVSLRNDSQAYLNCLVRHYISEAGMSLVIVFDNSDKRESDDQVRMFELCKWIQEKIQCTMILPMRDSTYRDYRHRPPLDSYVITHKFLITPPNFADVIRRRLELMASSFEASEDLKKVLTVEPKNYPAISTPDSPTGRLVAALYRTVTEEHSNTQERLFGIAGKNTRHSLEMFFQLCRSGFLPKYLTSRDYSSLPSIPDYMLIRGLMKGSRRYYDSSESYVTNLFDCSVSDTVPDHYVRANILNYVYSVRNRVAGDRRASSNVSDVVSSLVLFGHNEECIRREIAFLGLRGLLLHEQEGQADSGLGERIQITRAGLVHLRLSKLASYLAAVSEDTPIDDWSIARDIVDNISGSESRQFRLYSQLDNAAGLVDYLSNRYKGNLFGRFVVDDNSVSVFEEWCKDARSGIDELYRKADQRNGWTHEFSMLKSGDSVYGRVISNEFNHVKVKLLNGPQVTIRLHPQQRKQFAVGTEIALMVVRISYKNRFIVCNVW